MKIIAIANNKGGVGKTTTALCLAAGLREKKKKVLMIDLDMQQNLSLTCGVDTDDLNGSSLFDVLVANRKVDINDCIFQAYDDTPDLDILVGNISEDVKLKEGALKRALMDLEKDYDYVVIDTPPALNNITKLAIQAADDLIIPVQPSKYSLSGIGGLKAFIESENENINIAGLLLNCVNDRTKIGQKYIDDYTKVANALHSRLFNVKIPNSVAILEAQNNDVTIFQHAPKSSIASDYRAFINEYMKGSKKNGK